MYLYLNWILDTISYALQILSVFSSWCPCMLWSALHPSTSGYVSHNPWRDYSNAIVPQNQATPIVLVRDAYEAIVLTAFFYLLLMHLSDDPEEQKRIFLKKGLSKEADRIAIQKGLPMQKWCFPLGFIRWKPSVSSGMLCRTLSFP